MTIEIRQLVIRAVVTGSHDAERLSYPERGAAEPKSTGQSPSQATESRQTLVAACVREVMKRLERAQER